MAPAITAQSPHYVSATSAQSAQTGHALFRGMVYAMFFCSGLASLTCEIVWFRQLQFVLGSSTFAVSVVVACFFSGLALGSWWAGRLADRWSRLLRNYAFLEFGLAILTPAVGYFLSQWHSWIGFLVPWMEIGSQSSAPLMVFLSMVILLPPTTLMGATLPILGKFLVKQHSELAQRIGLLYAVNTLGAATGCLLVAFLLINFLGLFKSVLVASAIYGGIAFTAMILHFLLPVSPRAVVSGAGQRASGPAPSATCAEVSVKPLLVVFMFSGFAAIAYEVLWFRLLTFFNHRTVYTFSSMLFCYLLGLVLGAYICSRYLSNRKDKLLEYFASIQLMLAIMAFVSFALLGYSGVFLHYFFRLAELLNLPDVIAGLFSIRDLSVLALSITVLLVPTTLLGITFPLSVELGVSRLPLVGSRIGTLYGLNTLGGVMGSLLTGFVLLPWLGSQGSFMVIIAVNLALFFVLWRTQPALRRNSMLGRQGAITTLCLILLSFAVGTHYLKDMMLKFTDAKVLSFREDADATFAVLEYDYPHTGRFQQLVVNGASLANNRMEGRRYMAHLAHLPVLLHPNPETAAVIAIGTGTTAGSLTLHPTLKAIWAVDFSKYVFDVAPHFVPINQSFLESPKVKPVVADGRHFLNVTDERFDVLTFEPPPPVEAGVVNLYSREFYQLAKKRLKKGGILCQWIPFHLDMDREVINRMLLRSILDEFPHVSLWFPNALEGTVIASMEPLEIRFDQIAQRMKHAPLNEAMAGYGFGRPEQLLATFVTADEALREYVGDAPPVTDDHPRVEHFNPYPIKPFNFSYLQPFRRPLHDYIVSGSPEPAVLNKSIEVMESIWANPRWDSPADRVRARQYFRKALLLEPDHQFLLYVMQQLDFLDARPNSES